MAFSDEEAAYINSQRVARLATVSGDGQPDVVPVGYEFDGTDFYIAGMPLESTRKYRNVTAGNGKVALVVDDFVSVDPWTPRLLRVYGTAQVVTRDGRTGHGSYLKITPEVSWAWNLEGRPLGHPPSPGQFQARRTLHRPAA